MTQSSIDKLIESCCQGDAASWQEFVEQYGGIIFAGVQRVLGKSVYQVDRQRIEDVVQDVFIRLVKEEFRLLRTYDSTRASITTWLTIVARSSAIDAVRKRTLPTVPLENRDGPAATSVEEERGPEIPLHLLTDRQKIVLQMLFDEDRSVSEVARVLEVDEQTVRSTKHKALVRLRKHFEALESATPE